MEGFFFREVGYLFSLFFFLFFARHCNFLKYRYAVARIGGGRKIKDNGGISFVGEGGGWWKECVRWIALTWKLLVL